MNKIIDPFTDKKIDFVDPFKSKAVDPFAENADTDDKGGMGKAFGAGVDKLQELGYRAVKGFTDVGNEGDGILEQDGALSRFAQKGIDENIEEQKSYEPTVPSYKDVDSIGSAASYAGELVANSVPYMLGAVTPIGAGAMAGGLSQEAYEAQPEDEKNALRATASGVGQMALERLGIKGSLGEIGKDILKDGVITTAKRYGKGEFVQAAKDPATALAFSKRVIKGALWEGATESAQESLAMWGAGKDLNEFEMLNHDKYSKDILGSDGQRLMESFVGGATVGGVIRTGSEGAQKLISWQKQSAPIAKNGIDELVKQGVTQEDAIEQVRSQLVSSGMKQGLSEAEAAAAAARTMKMEYDIDHEIFTPVANDVESRRKALYEKLDRERVEGGFGQVQDALQSEGSPSAESLVQQQMRENDPAFFENLDNQVKPEKGGNIAEKSPEVTNITETEEKLPKGKGNIANLEVVEAPVGELSLSNDVPQFKSGANDKGVVEPLGGKFDRTGVSPIQVWVRKDGRKEVISGRHRTELAQRSGEQTIPAQYHYEENGFDKYQAAALDAILNVREGQGKVKDYVDFIKHTGLTEAEANEQGILARATGKRAYTIASQGSDPLIAAHRNNGITDEAAVRISKAAPNDEALQAVGIKAIDDGKTITVAENMVKAVKSFSSDQQQGSGDLFGFDDSAMIEAENLAKAASKKQAEIQRSLSAIQGAAKRPELAAKEGVNVKDPKAVKKRIEQLKDEKRQWDNWHTNPELVAQLKDKPDITQEQTPQATASQEAVVVSEPKENAKVDIDVGNSLSSDIYSSIESKRSFGVMGLDGEVTESTIDNVDDAIFELEVLIARSKKGKLTQEHLNSAIALKTTDSITFNGISEALNNGSVGDLLQHAIDNLAKSESKPTISSVDNAQASTKQPDSKKAEVIENDTRGKGQQYHGTSEAAFVSEVKSKTTTIKDGKKNVEVKGEPESFFDVVGGLEKSIDEAAHEAATSPNNDLAEPTVAQAEANNYKLGRIEHSGMKIGIENPEGSFRKGIDSDGKEWSNKINHHYGDLTGTKGADGDALDVFVKPGTEQSDNAYIIDQVDPKSGVFDEHKIMLGFENKAEAEKAYLSNYDKGWKGLKNISEVPIDSFKEWVANGNTVQEYAKPVISANAKSEVIKNDTRGKGQQYHGTSEPIANIEEYTYGTMNIYGQGLYTTDAEDIAQGYSKKGKGKNPTIHKVNKARDLTLLDLEKPLSQLTAKERKAITDADETLEDLIDSGDFKSVREVYDEFREDSANNGLSADDVQEVFTSIQFNLEKAGYDGIRHIGGLRTGKPPHNVEIIFNPKETTYLDDKNPAVKGALVKAKNNRTIDDNLFNTLETKETDKGLALFSADTSILLSPKKVTLKEAQNIVNDFQQEYNGNIPLEFRVVEKQEQLYGPENTVEKVGLIKGSYHPKTGVFGITSSNMQNRADGQATLRHEILGHYGLNTFKPADKKAILQRVINNKNHASLKAVWSKVDENYTELDTMGRAEEVFAILAEKPPTKSSLWSGIVVLVRKALRAIGIGKGSISKAEIESYIQDIAKSIKSGEAKQQTFPDTDQEQFRTEGSPENSNPINIHDETRKDAILRRIQDKFRRLKVIQRELSVNENNDTYMAEEAFHGKVGEDLRKLENEHTDKIAKTMADNDLSQDEVDLYLIAKHAQERNAYIDTINPELNGTGSGMSNQEAQAVLDKAVLEEKRLPLEAVASQVYSMLKQNREMMVEFGLEPQDAIDSWQQQYQYYVPLKGYAAEESARNDKGKKFGTGKGFNIKGRETIKAMGRRSLAESPLLHTISDTTQAIIRARKNEVGNAFLKLVNSNPDNELWQTFTGDNPDKKRGELPDGTVGQVNMTAFEMKASDEYFKTKIDGKEHFIKIHDPMLLQAMNNLGVDQMGSLTRVLGVITRTLSALVTTWNPEFMLTNFTRDVQAAVANVLAETQVADGKAVNTENLAKKMIKSLPKAMATLKRGFRDNNFNDGEWGSYLKEFLESGAKTGWVNQKDIESLASELKSTISRASNTKIGKTKRAGKAIADFVSDYNDIVENSARFSVYYHARKQGISLKQASSLAKNLTINFNRKGEIGATMNALFMFSNASVQGTANMLRALATPKDRSKSMWNPDFYNLSQKLAIGSIGATVLMANVMREIGGDDEDGESFYDKVPDHVKATNFVIMTGGKDYVAIPMPYGYNFLAGVGHALDGLIEGKSVAKQATKIALSTVSTFSPLGLSESDEASSSLLKMAAPTVLKPLAEMAIDENFFGGHIYPDDRGYTVKKADANRGTQYTWELSKNFTSWLNEATGGSEFRSGYIDFAPQSIDHLVKFMGGGVLQFGMRWQNLASKTMDGKDIESKDVPFARRFYKQINPKQSFGEFYDAKDQLAKYKADLDGLKSTERSKYIIEYKNHLTLNSFALSIDKNLRQLNKNKRAVEASKLSETSKEDKLQRIDDKKLELVMRFSKRRNELGLKNIH